MSLKLIETYLPLEALAFAAAKEMRAGLGSPSSLHLWWGNRQLAIAKAIVFAQLVDAPDFVDTEKTHLVHGILKGLLEGDALVEPKARELIRESCGDEWPTVYDPFCGVSTVPFAALTLGVPGSGGEHEVLPVGEKSKSRVEVEEWKDKLHGGNVGCENRVLTWPYWCAFLLPGLLSDHEALNYLGLE